MTELAWGQVVKIVMETKADNSLVNDWTLQTETQYEYVQRVRTAIAKELHKQFKEEEEEKE